MLDEQQSSHISCHCVPDNTLTALSTASSTTTFIKFVNSHANLEKFKKS